MPHMRINISKSTRRRCAVLTKVADRLVLNNYCGSLHSSNNEGSHLYSTVFAESFPISQYGPATRPHRGIARACQDTTTSAARLPATGSTIRELQATGA